MKRLISALVALGLMLIPACSLAAHGSISYDATVDADKEIAIETPFSASVDEVAVKAGDYVQKGDTVAVMRSTKAYATESGTVAAIFASVGNDATAASTRYSGVVYIEPTNKYTLYVDDKYAYENVEAMYPHLGDTVYLQCATDGSHVGAGRLTAIDDEGTYTVETTAGEFYPGEAVRVYNRQRKYDVDRIGRGTIIPTADAAVSGSGYIIAMHVAVGDTVEKGQLLFETVEDLSGYDEFNSLTITAPETGIVTSVEVSAGDSCKAHAVLAKICPIEDMCVKMELTEEDLAYVNVGDQMEIVFEQIPGELRVNGTVSSILYIPKSVLEEAEKANDSDKTSAFGASDSKTASTETKTETATDDTVYYSAYIDFTAVSELRLGMTATVYSLN